MTVYVAVENWCDDTAIIGVFSTEQQAEEAIEVRKAERVGRLFFFWVEPWELDTVVPLEVPK